MRGRDKLCEVVGGIPLLRLQVLRALKTGLPVFVTLPADMGTRAALLDGLDVTHVPVANAVSGIAASLKAGLRAAPQQDAILISLADLVDITTDNLQVVLKAATDTPDAKVWRGATEDGRPGHPILIAPDLRPAFAALTGDQGGAHILKQVADQTVLVPLLGDRARRDLDTPEDWDLWRKANPEK